MMKCIGDHYNNAIIPVFKYKSRTQKQTSTLLGYLTRIMVCGIPGPKRSRHGNEKYTEPPRSRILLTNGRFPVSLDLARQLYRAGNHVYCVDPMEYHVCKFSVSTKSSRQVPAPHADAKGYCAAVRKAIHDWEIDLVIPLHEEIFHLAESGDSVILQKLFAPPFDILIRLHNKWEFQRMMARFGLDVPEAHLCRNVDDVRNLDRSKEWSVKPVYGRASNKVHHLKPGEPVEDDIAVDDENHYVAQEWLHGNRYCSYSVLRNGRVQATGLYPVKDTIDGSSSVYFQQHYHRGIYEYIEQLAAHLPTVSAQLAFDFIEVGDRLVTMECNPRATSGIHLWSDTPYLARALTDTLDPVDDYTEPPNNILGRPPRRQVVPDMMMWEHKNASVAQFLKHLGRLAGTRDVLWSTRDLMPSLMQPFLLASYFKICREKGLQLPDMFQWDVVWEPGKEQLEEVRRVIG